MEKVLVNSKPDAAIAPRKGRIRVFMNKLADKCIGHPDPYVRALKLESWEIAAILPLKLIGVAICELAMIGLLMKGAHEFAAPICAKKAAMAEDSRASNQKMAFSIASDVPKK